ncbi:Uma2 family endonuclease [bacterium]|nr:Uma2 family endonuclease [bacterium]
MPAAITRTPPPPATRPGRFRWTTDLFHDICDAGYFEGRNVILVDGEIIDMPPPNPAHNYGLTVAAEVLTPLFRPGHFPRNQMALVLGLWTDPVPDLAFVPGAARDYLTRQATSAALVVEVSDTTLAYDTTEKAELYATGGIADYWVIDVTNERLLVFRDPRPLSTAPSATAYQTCLTLGRGDTVSPLALPGVSVDVADLLP